MAWCHTGMVTFWDKKKPQKGFTADTGDSTICVHIPRCPKLRGVSEGSFGYPPPDPSPPSCSRWLIIQTLHHVDLCTQSPLQPTFPWVTGQINTGWLDPWCQAGRYDVINWLLQTRVTGSPEGYRQTDRQAEQSGTLLWHLNTVRTTCYEELNKSDRDGRVQSEHLRNCYCFITRYVSVFVSVCVCVSSVFRHRDVASDRDKDTSGACQSA